MIKDIQELNFPSYATMSAATVSLPDMGEWNITSQIKIDGQIAPDFSFDWEVVHDGHKYIMPLRKPQGSKGNEIISSVIDLTFQHWAIYQLKRWFFFTVQPVETGTAVPDKYIASVILNLGDFCNLFGQVLAYYYGDTITIDLNPAWEYKSEPENISISYSHLWKVLTETLYDKYGVRWEIKPNGSYDKYVIKVGYPTTEQSHIFEYGFEGGLMKVERQVQSEDIRNMILGRGGEKNLPLRYFKNVDPENPSFKADPDWIPELANIPFTELRGATFRSYIQGWKAKHYGGTTTATQAYAPWAWLRGYTDLKFDPVEYVKDDESIERYGALQGGLDNNEDIYPTLQGMYEYPYGRLDEVVDVEPILSDDVSEAVESDAVLSDIPNGDRSKTVLNVPPSEYRTITLTGPSFDVPEGKTANLDVTVGILSVNQNSEWAASAELTDYAIKVYGSQGEISASGIPEGHYYYKVDATVHNMTTDKTLNITVGAESPKLTSATVPEKWTNTWNVWIKDIWGTAASRDANETEKEYAERVWRPILGDRAGNEAKLVFSDGWLSTSEDYEFTIVGIPVLDGTKSLNGVSSHWKLTLGKCDADLESTGLYVPSTKRQAYAGDHFFFIGIELPHQYVVSAEKRLDDWKKDNLREVKDIKPTWVVQTDRVRLNNEGKPDALIRKLHPGDTLRLADKRFIEGAYETLYLSSLTITYREPTKDDAALNPDVEIVLSDRYEVSANPVATLQGEVSALAKQVGSISNVEQIMRAVGDKLYLRKDGIYDRSMSPTEFASLVTSMGFRAGMVGGAGWGFYKDDNGNWVLETDRINVRQDMEVNNLVINQISARGGMIVESAAGFEIIRVEDTAEGYVCYFDQKKGTVANLFHLDDVAWCSRFTPENKGLKFYKRRVVRIEEDCVVLTKPLNEADRPDGWVDSGVNGTGIPAEGDVIVHYGNYTDKQRQYVKVRDVIGGGYERYIEGLDSVNATGVEYYFAGRQTGLYNNRPRWFIGDDNGFIEWINGVLNIKGKLSINSTIGDQTFEEYIKQVSPPVEREDIESFVDAIVDPKIEGIQNQIDGVIETWFYNGVPTLANYPANGWNTEALKIQHLGDLYYDNDTGTAYRFSQDAQGSYYWNTITDDAITKALAEAQKAQDTADSKRRVFISQPTSDDEYDEGDLWVNATYGTQYENDILRCITHKVKGVAFNIAHWTLASKYTDDSALNTFISEYETTIDDIKGQVDGKAQTWYQDTDPSITWNTPELKALHVGDLWYNTTNGTTWYWDGTQWKQQDIPDAVFDKIDGKADIFVSKPTSGYHKNDLWFLEAEYTLSDGKHAKGTLVVAINDMGAAWSANDWAKKDRYTDDTVANEALAKIAKFDYFAEAFKQKTTIEGGVVLTSIVSLGVNNTDFTSQVTYSGISGIYDATKRGSGIAAWYGGDMVDIFDYYNAANGTFSVPTDVRAAASLFRMDGTGYLSKGSLWWDAAGNLFLGSGVTIGGGSNGATLASILNAISGFSSLLVPIDAQGNELDWKNAASAVALKSRKHFCSDGEITALGYQAGGNGSGSAGASSLADLTDVVLSNLASGQALVYNGSKWVNQAIAAGLDETALASYLSSHNYITSAALNGYATTAQLGNYVSKAGDTMTGTLRVTNIEEPNGNGLIAYHPASWTGVSNTQWGVGTIDSQGVIRSSNASLIHYRNGVGNSTIWDSGNDGDGSGLDADMLDGLHASSFLRSMPIVAPTANFQDYMAGLKGINWRSGDTSLAYGAMRAMDAVLDVGNSWARFFRLMHNRNDGNLRFQGSTDADSAATAAWGTERTLLDTVNYADTLDSRYYTETEINSILSGKVSKSGDTMTGALTVNDNITSQGGRFNSALNGSDNYHFYFSNTTVGVTGGIGTSNGGPGAYLWLTGANNSWRFVTNNTERMRITADGSVLIGKTANAGYNLDVNGTTRVTALRIGDGTITWDADNGGFKFDKPLYSTGEITALGASGGVSGGNTVDLSNLVTLDTAQTITGAKTFTSSTANCITIRRSNTSGGAFIDYYALNSTTTFWRVGMADDNDFRFAWGTGLTNAKIDSAGNIYATAFKRSGGTSAQFLKADGSVDDTQYLYHRRVTAATALNIDTGITATGGGLFEINNAAGTLPINADWHKVFDWGANDNAYRVQMLSSLGSNSSMYFRHKVSGTWYPWRTLLDTVNYADLIDTRYVKKAGDTMTGVLNIVTSTPQAITIKRNVTGGGAYMRLVPSNQDSLFWSVGATTADIRFNYQGPSEENTRVTFTNDGSVLIGTTTNSSGAKLHVVGNIRATGTVTQQGSSDRRLKQRFTVEDYAARILRLGAVMDFEWSDRARAIDGDRYDAVRHTSVVWQRARKVGIPGFCGLDERGYGFVNWLNNDYHAVLLGAVQETIREVRRNTGEIERLRTRVKELEGIVYNGKRA